MDSSGVVMSWSGGKDSALALRSLDLPSPPTFLTTVNETNDRTSMHAVRLELIRRQVRSLGGDLVDVQLPEDCSNDVYEDRMQRALKDLIAGGSRCLVFGDVYLEDVREYRQQRFGSLGLDLRFPLWQQDTGNLASRFIEEGYRAVVICVDPDQLDDSFLGREFDGEFLDRLPEDVDPCGEDGEFHTFVYDGPCFDAPVTFRKGRRVQKGNHSYCDLVGEGG